MSGVSSSNVPASAPAVSEPGGVKVGCEDETIDTARGASGGSCASSTCSWPVTSALGAVPATSPGGTDFLGPGAPRLVPELLARAAEDDESAPSGCGRGTTRPIVGRCSSVNLAAMGARASVFGTIRLITN